jgi:hypothetical protein
VEISDFDAWRDNYCDMSYERQKRFYDQVAVDHPCQQAFDLSCFVPFFRLHANHARVLELGGWKGELAAAVLAKLPSQQVISWDNYEISSVALLGSVCRDERYQAIVPDDFVWNIDLPPVDIWVMSHFAEHIRTCHLNLLFSRMGAEVNWLLIESPLPEQEDEVDWTGYHGSHILEVGWRQLCSFLTLWNFKEVEKYRMGHFRAFERARGDISITLACGYPASALLGVCPAFVGSYLESREGEH